MRTVRDGRGRSWRVWHVKPQSEVLIRTSLGLGRGWLCFESDGDKRRLAQPPDDWERIPDDQLLELLRLAVEVKRVGA